MTHFIDKDRRDINRSKKRHLSNEPSRSREKLGARPINWIKSCVLIHSTGLLHGSTHPSLSLLLPHSLLSLPPFSSYIQLGGGCGVDIWACSRSRRAAAAAGSASRRAVGGGGGGVGIWASGRRRGQHLGKRPVAADSGGAGVNAAFPWRHAGVRAAGRPHHGGVRRGGWRPPHTSPPVTRSLPMASELSTSSRSGVSCA